MKTQSINPNELKTRDYNMISIINGATKSAVHIDRKKKLNKENCRRWKHINRSDDV